MSYFIQVLWMNFLFLVCYFNPVHCLVGGIIAIPAGSASSSQDSLRVLPCSPSFPGRAAHKLADGADSNFNR